MTLKAIKFYIIQLFVLVFLTACSSGSSEDGGNTVTGTSARMTMTVNDSSGNSTTSIAAGDALTANVRVTNSNGLAIANQEVSFTASSGTLSASARLTDSDGRAQVSFNSRDLSPSVVTITAVTTYNGETLTITSQFEIAELEAGVLALTLLDQNNAETNSITQGNSLAVTASFVTENGTGIADQAISFSATGGDFNPSSRLTASTGIATTSYDSTQATPGVITITATTTYQGQELSASRQVEVLQTGSDSQGAPSFSITFRKDGASTNRIQTDESAQISVSLNTNQNTPIANAIVTFTAELGTLNATTALTDSTGVAEVTITGSEGQLGAALATASVVVNGQTITTSIPYEVVDGDVVVDTTLKLGFIDDQGNFQSGIKSRLTNSNSPSTISAGGTLGLEIGVFDQNDELFVTPLTVAFNSTCVAASNATLDTSVTTINGIASTTFEDLSCATRIGNNDTVVATVTVNSTELTATHDITIQPEALGSIEFVSASPESIVIKGTGGQGQQESSTLTFRVRGELDNPLSDQPVTFSLNTEIGGLTLISTNGVTNQEGLVSAKVTSGTVPTAVRVTASASVEGGATITTQSDILSVNTGLPDQNSITLAVEEFNTESFNIVTTTTLTAYMADSFNNPVPDGTTINFTTEGGAIEPSCNTQGGSCQVTWTSQQPKVDNHRVTVLATAIGHESFVDRNGNNIYDSADGTAVSRTAVESGLGRATITSGFIDMSEAWRDDNENNVRDSNEQFIDSISNNRFDTRDGRFNGPQCSGSLCSSNRSAVVRKAAVLITSSSAAHVLVRNNASLGTIFASNVPGSVRNSSITLNRGDRLTLNIRISDTASQVMANGTNVTFVSTGATFIGVDSYTFTNTNGPNGVNDFNGVEFFPVLVNEVDEATTGELEISVTSPSGEQTVIPITVVLN